MKDYAGVQVKGSKYIVQFRVKNKCVCGGTYNTPEEAHAVYLKMTEDRNKEYIRPVDFIEGEEWREVAGYDGRYWVSNLGRIKNMNQRHTGLESLMPPHRNKDGYYTIHLRPKNHKLAVLIWVTFNGEYDRKKNQVNHKDLDKSNNRLDNLECIYVRENQCHSQQKIHNKTMMGCYFDNNKRKWIALISEGGKQRYLGAFSTQEEGHDRYLQEVEKIGETNKYSFK